MASIGNEPGGRKRILFVARNRRRKTIRLGKVSQHQAETVRGHVENLVAAAWGQAPPEETSRWVAGLPDLWRKRLEAAGLVAAAEPRSASEPKLTLGAFLDGYIDGRTDAKATTRTVWGHTRRNLVAFFGKDKPIVEITPGHADEWRQDLTIKGLADNTMRRRTGVARQFFRAAVRKHLLAENPFAGLSATVRGNPKRMAFVSRADTAAVLAALPDAKWRLAFALARYGGLRCPSEISGLAWSDISWERERFTVHAIKTEHHADAGIRVVPIFPELAPLFREAFEAAEPGAIYCCPQYPASICGQMYRKVVLQAMARAGVKPWPKLFQNCRASRETELAESYPVQVVCSWIGNSPAVAARHYLQTTEDHYSRATAEGGQSAAQNPAQYHAVSSLPEREGETGDVQERPDLPHDSESYMNVHKEMVGATGLEPVTSWV